MADRRERVILSLEDNFTSGMARAATQTALLDKRLESLDGNVVRANRSTSALGSPNGGIAQVGKQAGRAGKELDSYSGRLLLISTAITSLGPALIPISAQMAPALSGMAMGITSLATSAGTAVLAFAGLGDAMGALNDYQLEPTSANFEKMQIEFDKMGAAGVDFVRFLDSLGPQLKEIQFAAREGLFPGLEDSITELMAAAPGMRAFVSDMAETMGDLAASASASLMGDSDWQAFFDYMQSDAAPTLQEFGVSLGNFTAGLANMMTAFAPLTRDFSDGMVRMSRSFREWADGLSESDTFQGFIDYIRESGPMVREFFASFSDAVVGLLHAFAPWGEVVLPALTSLLDLVGAIGSSNVGPALATMAAAFMLVRTATTNLGPAMTRAQTSLTNFGTAAKAIPGDLRTMYTTMATAGAASERQLARFDEAAGRTRSTLGRVGGAAASAAPSVAAMGALASGMADEMGLTNTATLALAGSMAGPWGAAMGAGVGMLIDFSARQSQAAEAARALSGTLDEQTGALTRASFDHMFADLDLASLRDAGVDLDLMSQNLGRGTDGLDALRAQFKAANVDFHDGFLLRSAAGDAAADVLGLAHTVDESKKSFAAQKEASKGAAQATRGNGRAARFAAVSLAELTAKQRGYSAATLESIDAGTGFGQALADARKQAERGTQGFSRFTEAGRANRTVMSGLIGSYNKQSEAVKNNVGEYRRARANVEQLAKEMGLTERQTNLLTNALHKPKEIRVKDAQVRAARDAARALLDQINAVDGREVNVRVVTTRINEAVNIVRNAANATRQADGGIWRNNMQQFANGGLDRPNDHQPEIAPGGAWRVWAEPETKGEAYIPLANDYRRPRAKSIAEETVGLLGGSVEWFANGGTRNGDFIRSGQRAGRADIGARGAAAGLRALERASNRLEKQVERERNQRKRWVDERNEVRSTTRSGLTAELWGDGASNVFASANAAGSPGHVMQQLRSQRSRAYALSRAVRILRRKGLNGAAMAEIMNAPDPLAAAQQFAALPASQVRNYERLYQSSTAAVNRAGRVAGDAAYGAQVKQQTRELRHANERLRRVNDRIERVEKAIKAKQKADDKSRRNAADRTGNKVTGAAGAGKRNQRYARK